MKNLIEVLGKRLFLVLIGMFLSVICLAMIILVPDLKDSLLLAFGQITSLTAMYIGGNTYLRSKNDKPA